MGEILVGLVGGVICSSSWQFTTELRLSDGVPMFCRTAPYIALSH